MFESISKKEKNTFKALKEKFGYKNVMQAPKLSKVIVSIGVGSVKDKKKLTETIPQKLELITGQKVSTRKAKKSIASFKVREGEVSGYMVTLRGERMRGFLDKLIHIALPRTKDFRGISRDAVDAMGNFGIGIKENSIFPETSDQDLKDVFGMGINIITTSKSKEETIAFLEYLGFPLKKTSEKKVSKRAKK